MNGHCARRIRFSFTFLFTGGIDCSGNSEAREIRTVSLAISIKVVDGYVTRRKCSCTCRL